MKVENMTLVITDPCYLRPKQPLMSTSTIYGDWSCMVYSGKLEDNGLPKKWWEYYREFWAGYNQHKTKEELEILRTKFKALKEEWSKNILGEFCADSGQVAVFDYDTLSEKQREWLEEHSWCATIIKNFTGTIKFYDSSKETRHVIGEGDKPFFSVQSGF